MVVGEFLALQDGSPVLIVLRLELGRVKPTRVHHIVLIQVVGLGSPVVGLLPIELSLRYELAEVIVQVEKVVLMVVQVDLPVQERAVELGWVVGWFLERRWCRPRALSCPVGFRALVGSVQESVGAHVSGVVPGGLLLGVLVERWAVVAVVGLGEVVALGALYAGQVEVVVPSVPAFGDVVPAAGELLVVLDLFVVVLAKVFEVMPEWKKFVNIFFKLLDLNL